MLTAKGKVLLPDSEAEHIYAIFRRFYGIRVVISPKYIPMLAIEIYAKLRVHWIT